MAGALAYDFARPRRPRPPTPLLVAVAVDRFEVEEVVGRRARLATGRATAGGIDLPAFSNMSRDDHRRRVLRIKEHIAAGDIYQANLSQRFELPFGRGGLASTATCAASAPPRSRATSARTGSRSSPPRPSGFSWWTASGPGRGRSRARGRAPPIPDADRALAAELILSPKERAEHLMLVDLARNDLGKVAAIGSVAVDELMTVEDYAQVRHIVSNVSARLLPGATPSTPCSRSSPAAPSPACPRSAAWRSWTRWSRSPRGFYTGALFYATPSGRLDANILIRSAVVAGGNVTFQTGGGIVADSDPDAEYEETLHKAEGLRLALEAALPLLDQ